jgi:hypothetical protein
MSKSPNKKEHRDLWQGIALWTALIVNIFYVVSAVLALLNYFQPKKGEKAQ